MISYLANPERFLRFERVATPIFGIIAVLTLVLGLWMSLIGSPPAKDHHHGVRLMYVHVPAAYGALMAYTALAAASFVSFVWRLNLADVAARSFAVPGAAFTFLALVTGSLWGKPAWGTWWQWDGRMTSVLILFFIYLAYLSLWHMIDNKKQAARLASILAMVGFINIPIIKYSVEWWNSLHQSATISNIGAPGLPPQFYIPLGLMIAAYTALFAWLSLRSIRTEIMAAKARRRDTKPAAKMTMETL